MKAPLSFESCPRFDSCRAQACPLDAGWERRVIGSEGDCHYLRAFVKEAWDQFEGVTGIAILEKVRAVAPAIFARHTGLHSRLTRNAHLPMKSAPRAASPKREAAS